MTSLVGCDSILPFSVARSAGGFGNALLNLYACLVPLHYMSSPQQDQSFSFQ